MMTREQYKRLFENTKNRGWRKDKGYTQGMLRCTKGYCPIVAAADEAGGVGFEEVVTDRGSNPNCAPLTLGWALGLRTELVDGIVAVADGNNTIEGWVAGKFRHQPKLRPIYLEALHDALDPLFEAVK